jgi:hypothetical protein
MCVAFFGSEGESGRPRVVNARKPRRGALALRFMKGELVASYDTECVASTARPRYCFWDVCGYGVDT